MDKTEKAFDRLAVNCRHCGLNRFRQPEGRFIINPSSFQPMVLMGHDAQAEITPGTDGEWHLTTCPVYVEAWCVREEWHEYNSQR